MVKERDNIYFYVFEQYHMVYTYLWKNMQVKKKDHDFVQCMLEV